jgi:hypothetical protein
MSDTNQSSDTPQAAPAADAWPDQAPLHVSMNMTSDETKAVHLSQGEAARPGGSEALEEGG